MTREELHTVFDERNHWWIVTYNSYPASDGNMLRQQVVLGDLYVNERGWMYDDHFYNSVEEALDAFYTSRAL